jgi:hypothetical protein
MVVFQDLQVQANLLYSQEADRVDQEESEILE